MTPVEGTVLSHYRWGMLKICIEKSKSRCMVDGPIGHEDRPDSPKGFECGTVQLHRWEIRFKSVSVNSQIEAHLKSKESQAIYLVATRGHYVNSPSFQCRILTKEDHFVLHVISNSIQRGAWSCD